MDCWGPIEAILRSTIQHHKLTFNKLFRFIDHLLLTPLTLNDGIWRLPVHHSIRKNGRTSLLLSYHWYRLPSIPSTIQNRLGWRGWNSAYYLRGLFGALGDRRRNKIGAILEVCGSCGVDHRMTNYQIELANTTDDFEVVDCLQEGMLLLIVKDTGFNPALSCEPWPNGRPIGLGLGLGLARTATAFGPTESSLPEFAKLPVRRVRENVVIAGRRWDQFLACRSNNEPMARLIL